MRPALRRLGRLPLMAASLLLAAAFWFFVNVREQVEVGYHEKQAAAKKEAKKVEEEEDENAKDGVSLDELFKMKPEIFQTAGEEEEEGSDKKKGKKGKKKSVELEFDEERGEVVGRKKHKRGDDDFGEDW